MFNAFEEGYLCLLKRFLFSSIRRTFWGAFFGRLYRSNSTRIHLDQTLTTSPYKKKNEKEIYLNFQFFNGLRSVFLWIFALFPSISLIQTSLNDKIVKSFIESESLGVLHAACTQNFSKNQLSYPLIRTSKYLYLELRNVIFSENSA